MNEKLFNGNKNITSERILLARERKGITQMDLAARLQTEGVVIDNNGICKIENNNRGVSDFELKYIAKHLDVSIEWLLDEEAPSSDD